MALGNLNLNLEQTAELVTHVGPKRTVLVEGHMGTGKSSLLGIIANNLNAKKQETESAAETETETEAPKKSGVKYTAFYCDCTTKDVGDIMLPVIHEVDQSGKFVRFVTNEELGAHTNKPVIIMLDEFGKCNRAVQNALRRLMLERKIGAYTLHEDSIVFATTNLGAENVGDVMEAHKRNAIISVRMKKPTAEDWIVNFGFLNDLHAAVLGFAKEYPQIMDSFEDVSPEDNPYIFHPKEVRAAFVTPRSLHTASDILKTCEGVVDKFTLQAALMGAIGPRAGADLMAFVTMVGQLHSIDDIKRNPEGLDVPSSSAAVIMTVSKVLGAMDSQLINPWMKFLRRLPKEAQAMFARSALKDSYKHNRIVTRSEEFSTWVRDNASLFMSDRR